MEIKKTQTTTTTEKQARKNITEFVSDMKSEIQKVQWTSKEELITYTKIVVIATFAFGMGIYFTDLIIQGSLLTLNYLLSFIAG